MSNGDAGTSICKRQKVALDDEQIDRISSLPDELLAHILSFLPTKDAVKTVLIRRFGNLWTSINNLDFDVCSGGFSYEDRRVNEERLISDILTELKLVYCLVEPREHIRLRSLKFLSLKDALISDKTMIEIISGCPALESLFLYRCYGFHKLDFSSCVEPREHIQFRSLKSLSLKDMLISDKTMIELISGCPALESLFLFECYGFHRLDFTCRNLKNVVIELNWKCSSRLEVSCPYVTSLNITGIERTDLYNVSSVVDAALEFDNDYFNCACGEYREVKLLFEQLHDAVTLFTRSVLVFTIWELTKSSCPSMNWRRLVLKTMLTEWHFPGIASLLRNSPDLEMLDIHIMPGTNPFYHRDDQWLMHFEIDGENFWDFQQSSFYCLRSHLKTIRIRSFKIESCAVKLVHFLLRKACVLEKLVIETNRNSYPDEENLFTSETWKEFSEDIRSSQRASPQAVILIL
ncbi:F-box/LRR-repeat protein At3g03360-like [Rhododendron vialii]|uniref:F-box/LRR-repeat protein At3g03360-like n=1 Tax=Rhododendron vialii TaxID=182163 RepID=UPI00265DD25E|nr:F-box/LRR-repeat protein At3g03360-like [Rhododendron vialii]